MGNQTSSINSQTNDREELQSLIPEKYRIERISDITPEDFFRNYYLPQKPVILTGMMKDWPAREKWTNDYLKQQIGEYNHKFSYEGKSITMKVGEFIDLANRFGVDGTTDPQANGFPELPSKWEKLPYIRHFGPLKNKPTLNSDLRTSQLFSKEALIATTDYLFVGLPGTKTEIHFDGSHNFVSMIRGQKHIALLPPGDHPSMFDGATPDQMSVWHTKTVFPIIDPPTLCLDLSKYSASVEEGSPLRMMHEHPRLDRCQGLLYSPIYEGEIVFFPAMWYHYIHNVDFSISVTTQTHSKNLF